MTRTPEKRSAFSKPDDYKTGPDFQQNTSNQHDSLEPDLCSRPSSPEYDKNIYIPPPPVEGSVPDNVKIDLTTPLEAFWIIAGIAMLLIAFYFYSEGSYGHYSKRSHIHYPPQPHLLTYLPWALFAAFASFLSWFFTDNYYIFNTKLKKILYHFKYFSYVTINEYLSADRIFAIGVSGTKKRSKHRSWWEYKIVVIDSNGLFTDFSNYVKSDDLYEINEKARGMAAVMGCRFAQCPPQNVLKASIENGKVSYVYYEGENNIFNFNINVNGVRTSDGIPPLTVAAIIAGFIMMISAIILFSCR